MARSPTGTTPPDRRPPPGGRGPRPGPHWLFIAVIIVALVAFAGFAASLAVSTFRQRIAQPRQAWTPAGTRPPVTLAPVAPPAPPLTATPTPAPSPSPSATTAPAAGAPTPTPQVDTPTATVETPAPAPTARPTAAPSATPCTVPLALELSRLYNPAVFGCPTGDTRVVWAAWETFERGALLWRSDTDAAYAFLDGGGWRPVDARWDGRPVAGRGEPPPGLMAPERGFGWAWSIDDALYGDLGWATGAEKGFCAQVQPFEHGFLLISSTVIACTPGNLYNHATSPDWQPVALAAHTHGWSGTRPDFTLPPDVPGRPAAHGIFPAPRLDGLAPDGSPDEWPGPWLPLTAIVSGAGRWAGAEDLSAAFQVAWDDGGLYLAVEVVDDLYRPGPAGTDLWLGDSLEINFDRDLPGDFDTTESSDDDYQVGLSFGPELALMLGYRWLPFVLEGPLDLPGAAVAAPRGYTAEVFLPWELFGLARGDLAPGATFGFNVALNDNDGDAPELETVASASAARITYDDPTQWGTLVLR